jgi:chlorite dismutase
MSAESPKTPQHPEHSASGTGHGQSAAPHTGPGAGGRPPAASGETNPVTVDVWERTKGFAGPVQAMDRRIFMQLSVFDCDPALGARRCLQDLGTAISSQGAAAVLYQDMNNPFGIGVLSWSTDPADFVTKLRPCFEPSHVQGLKPRHDFSMVGRSYASGFESDLQFWLLDRPVQTVLNENWPWAIWYPLRRSGAFARLDGREQGAILKEHGEIGRAYGEQDLAHDVRLACHGLDARDNEFLIGLIGKDLHPLSHVVQAMRKTRQTAEFISQMGPFFVGYVASRHAAR